MPLTGHKTSRICQWIFACQMTPLESGDESGAMAIAATVVLCQLLGPLRGKKSRMGVKQSLDLTPLPTPRLLVNQSLDPDQRQTLRPLRRIECLTKKQQKLALFQTPTFLSLWTSLERTWHSLMSLQILRVVNYVQILSWI